MLKYLGTTLAWGFILALVGLFLWGVSTKVQAQATPYPELNKLLKGKEVIHNDHCLMKSDEEVAKPWEQPSHRARCEVGVDPNVPTKHYVTILDQKGYRLLLELDLVQLTQKVIWKRKGTET